MGYILTEYMVCNNGKKKPAFYFGGWHKKYADMIYIATKDTAYVFEDEDLEKARETVAALKMGGYNFQIKNNGK